MEKPLTVLLLWLWEAASYLPFASGTHLSAEIYIEKKQNETAVNMTAQQAMQDEEVRTTRRNRLKILEQSISQYVHWNFLVRSGQPSTTYREARKGIEECKDTTIGVLARATPPKKYKK
jgi:hypothetical protein